MLTVLMGGSGGARFCAGVENEPVTAPRMVSIDVTLQHTGVRLVFGVVVSHAETVLRVGIPAFTGWKLTFE